MADAQFESFFAAGGGGVGLFPVFPPATTWRSYASGQPRGFVGDGDYINLSLSSAELRYFNNAGAQIWGKVPSDIAAGVDYWMTFNFDLVDGLLWVFAFNSTTEAVYTATINAAGTVVVKGSFTSTAALSVLNSWQNAGTVTTARGGSAWRTTPGAGNFTVITTGTVYVVDSATGAKVSETTAAAVYPDAGSYPLASGHYLAVQTGLVGDGETSVVVYCPSLSPPQLVEAPIPAPRAVGLPYTPGATVSSPVRYAALQWAGKVYLRVPGTSTPLAYDRLEFDEAVDALIANYRLDQ